MDRERQKSELYKGLWQMANDLRGAVDAWDFKNYVFSMLFYRYLSENLTNYINKIQREFNEKENIDEDFNYEEISDEEAEIARKSMTESLGYYIVPSELFCNIRKNAKGNENLNEAMDKVFKHIEESTVGQNSNETFKGIFDDVDFASNKLGSTVDERNKRIVSLLDGVGGMNLGSYEDNSIDTFGDAYEYLMGMYAANAGKSGGHIDKQWNSFVKDEYNKEIEKLVSDEHLKRDPLVKLMSKAFRSGEFSTEGTVLDDCMPPMSLFDKRRSEKKEKIISMLLKLFEKFTGLL